MKKGEIICLLAAVLATACGTSPGAGSHGSPPLPNRSPSASPASSPSPSGAVISTLACRLPVNGGWITFPGGQFASDPASSSSYDRAIGAWVPAPYENVAPDGASYLLYRDPSTEVPNAFYFVDAKTGKRRLIVPTPALTTSSEWQVVTYAREGVYLSLPSVGMAQAVRGLWLMDPQTGKVRLINGQYFWRMVSGGSAWALEPWTGPDNASWPSPRSGGYKVYRLDLGTGKVVTWYQTKKPIRLLSPTPDGAVLIDYGTYSVAKLALVSGPGLFAPIALPRNFPVLWDARMTRPGVWLNLVGGIALYVKGEGVKVVARNPDPTRVYVAAGGCW